MAFFELSVFWIYCSWASGSKVGGFEWCGLGWDWPSSRQILTCPRSQPQQLPRRKPPPLPTPGIDSSHAPTTFEGTSFVYMSVSFTRLLTPPRQRPFLIFFLKLLTTISIIHIIPKNKFRTMAGRAWEQAVLLLQFSIPVPSLALPVFWFCLNF